MARDVMDQVRRGEMTLTRQRALAHSATLVTLDKQGRVTVDEKLRTLRPPRARARRSSSSGNLDRAEVWCEELYERVAAAGRGELAGGPGMTRRRAAFEHRPVMLDEIVDVFATVPAGVVLDATLGGGGHSEAILDRRDRPRGPRHRPRRGRPRRGRRPGSPASATASTPSTPASTTSARSWTPTRSPARDLDDGLSGALFDLGVSSPQLDRGERGFSYRQDGPLDMRMDQDAPWSAADVVNGYDVDELTRVIRRYGDERFAARIARAIVAARPDRVDRRAGRHRHRGDPGRRPAHRRPPGQAHVPGHPHRGQRRARRPARRPRRGDRGHQARRPDRRALVPLRRGPHRQGALPRGHRRLRLPARPAVRVRRRADRAPRPRRAQATVGRPSRPPTRGPRRPACASPSASSATSGSGADCARRTTGGAAAARRRPAARGRPAPAGAADGRVHADVDVTPGPAPRQPARAAPRAPAAGRRQRRARARRRRRRADARRRRAAHPPRRAAAGDRPPRGGGHRGPRALRRAAPAAGRAALADAAGARERRARHGRRPADASSSPSTRRRWPRSSPPPAPSTRRPAPSSPPTRSTRSAGSRRRPSGEIGTGADE